MERILSSAERIKRAEEIYQRRKMQGGVRVSTNNVNSSKEPEIRLFKKMILQVIICLLIYFIFYLIQNSNYIFSEEVINKTRQFLSYDINFQDLYNQIGNYYNEHIAILLQKKENKDENNNIKEEGEKEVNTKDKDKKTEEDDQGKNEQTQSKTNSNNQNENLENGSNNSQNVANISTNEQPGIGGGEEGEKLLAKENTNEEEKNISNNEENTNQNTQMDIDANEIKSNYNLIIPLNGTISSHFGPRTATSIISGNHAGIDIAANEGTIFIAAMEGTVTEVSNEGGYGNHVYIQKNDVITLYAHCKKIYVKEGDKVQQAQQIGEVGQTGNATGPHLHFEIRKQSRVVNPEYILKF